uniref:Uncharacterized protein n=1 Tax=Rousettus aegyptiacus TaxID=9407 RepID=A0A7J8FIX0_ROUAE|nr:hypothetical protein HJG63_012092 [Rousettus aegyptiacus]
MSSPGLTEAPLHMVSMHLRSELKYTETQTVQTAPTGGTGHILLEDAVRGEAQTSLPHALLTTTFIHLTQMPSFCRQRLVYFHQTPHLPAAHRTSGMGRARNNGHLSVMASDTGAGREGRGCFCA